MSGDRTITIFGAGLAGALLATLLSRRGIGVTVFERRPDPRRVGYAGGRSINLALAERGMDALRRAGLERVVLDQAVMMRGRMVHDRDGRTQLLRYGRDDSEVIWSVHRGHLNLALLDAAEAAGATIHFGQRLVDADFAQARATVADEESGTVRHLDNGAMIGADGAGSALRQAMARVADLGETVEPLGHSYRELEIPPTPDGGFRIEPNALHIWPRGGYMCIALPNTEKSFTVTLFLPASGPHPSFETLQSVVDGRALFEAEFADALAQVPDFDADWQANPVSALSTLRLARWHLDGRALLIGDAAHAIVPFHGQGMNAAFEDCVALDALLREHQHDYAAAFPAFERLRKPNAEAIADMAIENYLEMRDLVDDPDFLIKKQIERALAERLPGEFVPRYALVTFTTTPYADAKARGAAQWEIVEELARGKHHLDQVDLERGVALARAQLVFR